MEISNWAVLISCGLLGIIAGFLLCAFLAVRKVHQGFDITLINDSVEFRKR